MDGASVEGDGRPDGAPASAPIPILVVDDEVPQMRAVRDTLNDNGYAAVGFSNGPDALAALATTRFDLILSDLMMPGMDGIALLQAAQRIDPDLIGIIMTGAGTIATAVEAMKAGALDYVLKPFRVSEILPVLSRAHAVRRLRLENVALQRRVQERTAELEASNRELEAFSHSVSHDLRAPLRSIDGFTRILLEDHRASLPADAQGLLDSVVRNTQRMSQLIDDLLRFSRLGRQTLRLGRVDMAALFREQLEEQRRDQAGRDIRAEVADLPACVGDLGLLKQVVVNLVSNALKFTRRRDVATIEVGWRRQGTENVYFIKDNGSGFDPAFASGLFGVFQRLHRADEFEGTGVGLSIVQRIVQRHGGRIWAESAVDQGATFSFTLPEAASPAAA